MAEPNRRYTNIALAVQTLVIFVLILWIIFHKPSQVDSLQPHLDKIKSLRDSCQILQGQVDTQIGISNKLYTEIDRLNSLPPKIKFIYDDQKKKLPGHSSDQLDSTIRANSGLPTKRHK